MKCFLKNYFVIICLLFYFFSAFSQNHTGSAASESDSNSKILSNSNIIAVSNDLIPHVIFVEKNTSKIFIYSTAEKNIIKSYYCSTGLNQGEKLEVGDLKTPEGIYFFTKIREDNQLLGEYGIAADEYGKRAYIINYPNKFDLLMGKNGSGIWLHATNDPERLKNPYNTKGCVVINNFDVLDISKYIYIKKTPFIIIDRMSESQISIVESLRDEILNFVADWEKNWESGDIDKYMSFYSEAFWSRGKTHRSWRSYKKRLFKLYENIEVSLMGVSVFKFNEDIIICFNQDFKTGTYFDSGFKRLYLRKEDGKLKILGEEWFPHNLVIQKIKSFND